MIKPLTYLNLPIKPFLLDAGWRWKNDNTCIVPKLGEATVYEKSLAFRKTGNAALAMGAVDVAAWSIRLSYPDLTARERYEKAVEYIRRNHLFPELELEFREAEATADELYTYRKLFDFINHWHQLDTNTGRKQFVLSTLNEVGVTPNVYNNLFCCISPKGVQDRLIPMLEKVGIALEWDKTQCALITPYYDYPHNLCALELRETANSDILERITLHPFTIAYAGLCHLPHRPMSIGTDIMKLAMVKRYDHTITKVLPNPSIPGDVWLPEDCQVVVSDDTEIDDIRTATQMVKCGKNVKLIPLLDYIGKQGDMGKKGNSLTGYVINRILELTAGDCGLSQEAEKLLYAAGPSPDLKARLVGRLRMMNRLRTMEEINQRFSDGILVETKKADVILTGGGYKYHEKSSGSQTLITNFLMELKRQIIFPEQAERYISTEFNVQDRSHELVIPESAFESGKRLNNFLQSQETNLPQAPRIIEASKSSQLLAHFRLQMTKLDIQEGLSYMGWDGLRTRFYGRDFVAHEGSVEERELQVFPNSTDFQFYKPGLVEPALHTDLPQDLCRVISIVVAYIHRYFTGYACTPVIYHNHANTRKALSKVFRGLGQENPIVLNKSRGGSGIRGLSGYPFYAMGGGANVTRLENTPALVLGDQGLMVENHDEETLQKASECLAYMVRATVPALAQDNPQPWIQEPCRRVLYSASLEDEGASIICQSNNLKQWPQALETHPYLESALSRIRTSAKPSALLYDMFNQQVTLRTRLLQPKMKKDELQSCAKELTTLVGDVQVHKDEITMDAIQGMRVFDQYFNGNAPYDNANSPILDDAADG